MTEGIADAECWQVVQDPERRGVRITTPRLLLRDIVDDDRKVLMPYWSERDSQANILRCQRDPQHTLRYLRGLARYNQLVPWQSREVQALTV